MVFAELPATIILAQLMTWFMIYLVTAAWHETDGWSSKKEHAPNGGAASSVTPVIAPSRAVTDQDARYPGDR